MESKREGSWLGIHSSDDVCPVCSRARLHPQDTNEILRKGTRGQRGTGKKLRRDSRGTLWLGAEKPDGQRERETRAGETAWPRRAPIPQYPSISSVPPTSCATPRNWCCSVTLWVSCRLH